MSACMGMVQALIVEIPGNGSIDADVDWSMIGAIGRETQVNVQPVDCMQQWQRKQYTSFFVWWTHTPCHTPNDEYIMGHLP
jgi:hypothetical protein